MTKTTKTKAKTRKNPQTKTRIKSVNGKHSTAASTIIDAHYANLNIKGRWTTSRIEKLCSFLRITVAELGSVLGVQHGWWLDHVKSTKPLSGPICILLTIMESHFMGAYTDDVITNLFDYNGKQKNT